MDVLYRDGYLYNAYDKVKSQMSAVDVKKYLDKNNMGWDAVLFSVSSQIGLENLTDITFVKANKFTAKLVSVEGTTVKFELANGILSKATITGVLTGIMLSDIVINIKKTITKRDAPVDYTLPELFNVDIYLDDAKITTQKVIKGEAANLNKGDGAPMSGIPNLNDDTKEYQHFRTEIVKGLNDIFSVLRFR